ncbi:MAG: hypothetical protein C5B50_11685 [Verrucomicrobia bacterium]|nr:MAG: hypothetical protein C5B50_11685 [Verrucomicrobiota bacterium]
MPTELILLQFLAGMFTKETSLLATRVIFNLIVRLIGLIFLYQGLTSVPIAVENFRSLMPHFMFPNFVRALWLVGWPFLIAWWMVRGAPWLMRLAFRDEQTLFAKQPENQG